MALLLSARVAVGYEQSSGRGRENCLIIGVPLVLRHIVLRVYQLACYLICLNFLSCRDKSALCQT